MINVFFVYKHSNEGGREGSQKILNFLYISITNWEEIKTIFCFSKINLNLTRSRARVILGDYQGPYDSKGPYRTIAMAMRSFLPKWSYDPLGL